LYDSKTLEGRTPILKGGAPRGTGGGQKDQMKNQLDLHRGFIAIGKQDLGDTMDQRSRNQEVTTEPRVSKKQRLRCKGGEGGQGPSKAGVQSTANETQRREGD